MMSRMHVPTIRAPAASSQLELTPREQDILPYLISGKSNKYISIELSISMRTAEAHRANILRKVGVRSTMELACRVCPHRRARE